MRLAAALYVPQRRALALALPLTLTLASCAPPTGQAVEPLDANTADLTLALTPQEDGSIQVALTAPGAASGQTTLRPGDRFGDTRRDPAWFDSPQLSCTPACTGVTGDLASGFVIDHAPGATVTLDYRMARTDPPQDVDDYRIQTGPSAFHAFAPLALHLPVAEPDAPDLRVRIEWSGDHPLFTPFGVTDSVITGVLRDQDRDSFLLAAGPEHTIRTGAGGAIGAISFSPELIGSEAIIARVAPLVDQTRALFPDTTESWYYITVQLAGEEIDNGFALGGTAVRSAFSLYATPGLEFDAYGYVLDGIVAHEYFHNWNGIAFFISGEEEHGARWFVEGFTDFYTRRVAHRAGVWSGEQALQHLNEQISYFQASPQRAAPLAEIIALWEAGDPASQVSYKRGDLLALAMDEEIRAASGGARSLDDLMRHLTAMAAAGDAPNVEDVFDWLAAETSTDFAAQMRAIVEEGGDIPLPAQVSELGARLSDDGARYELAP